MIEQALLSEIEAAAKSMGIAPATLCERAVQNTRLPQRLREGGSVTLATVNRLRSFIATHSSGQGQAA